MRTGSPSPPPTGWREDWFTTVQPTPYVPPTTVSVEEEQEVTTQAPEELPEATTVAEVEAPAVTTLEEPGVTVEEVVSETTVSPAEVTEPHVYVGTTRPPAVTGTVPTVC